MPRKNVRPAAKKRQARKNARLANPKPKPWEKGYTKSAATGSRLSMTIATAVALSSLDD